MAEEFDPEAYMDSKLEPGQAPAALGPPPGAPPPDDEGERPSGDDRKKNSRRERSRSRSRERRRSRSRDRGRKDDRYRQYDSRRGGGRHDDDRGGGRPRYTDDYKFESESRGGRSGGGDRKKAEEPAADDEEGFDRDMRTLFVAQVARKADERDLFQFFTDCGKVLDVRIIKDTQSRKSKGIAYVEFEKQESVVTALGKSGQICCGFPIVVQASQAEKNQAARLAAQVAGDIEVPTKVRVENLHPDIAEQDLTDLFTPFGKVVNVRIEKVNGRSSGLAHVEFKSLPDAQKAVAHLHGFDLAGKQLRVVLTSNPPPVPAPIGAGVLGGVPGMMMGMLQQPGGMPGMPQMMLNQLQMQRMPEAPANPQLDDNEVGGVHVSAQSRHMLMQKLARNTDLQGLGLPFAPTMPAPPPPGMPGPMPGAFPGAPSGVPRAIPGVPIGQANPSTFLMLVNMFDPATETEKDFHVDIQEDVKEECESKFGRVIQCIADKTNANGLVFLQFDSIESSAKAQAGLQGRFFAGKQIQAQYLAQAMFDASVPRNQV